MTPSLLRGLLFTLACLSMVPGCLSPAPSVKNEVVHTGSPALQIPVHVERLAILYPKVSAKEILNGYRRLEAATFQLKSQRPTLRIVDRLHREDILGEQRFQLTGGTSDDSVVRIGRMLGIDSVIIYSIEVPGLRDRVRARLYGELPPVIVTSQLLKIETGEVLYYNIVASRVPDPPGGWSGFGNHQEIQPEIVAALERGLRQTVEDLRRAFRE